MRDRGFPYELPLTRQHRQFIGLEGLFTAVELNPLWTTVDSCLLPIATALYPSNAFLQTHYISYHINPHFIALEESRLSILFPGI